jgi:hypothetical protein
MMVNDLDQKSLKRFFAAFIMAVGVLTAASATGAVTIPFK